ncbi:unnamed protein product, partial [Iphiclides podalirius]
MRHHINRCDIEKSDSALKKIRLRSENLKGASERRPERSESGSSSLGLHSLAYFSEPSSPTHLAAERGRRLAESHPWRLALTQGVQLRHSRRFSVTRRGHGASCCCDGRRTTEPVRRRQVRTRVAANRRRQPT